MATVVSDTVNGLGYGFVVALLALGFSLVMGTTHLINFPQGETYMIGAFAGAGIASVTGNLFLAIVVGALAGAITNVCVYVVVFMRIRRQPMITTLLAGLGASLAIRTAFGDIFGVNTNPFPTVSLTVGNFRVDGQLFSDQLFVLIGVALLLLVAGYVLLYRTSFGLQVRALADSASAVESIGMSVVRLQALVFAWSGALSGAAGVLIGWYLGNYAFTMGEDALAVAFAASVIGGLGSLQGAVVGGLIVGLVRNFGASWNPQLIDAYPFAFLIVFLLIRPTGLFGKSIQLTD
jgi:branched-chain amino acid transport system permease protein